MIKIDCALSLSLSNHIYTRLSRGWRTSQNQIFFCRSNNFIIKIWLFTGLMLRIFGSEPKSNMYLCANNNTLLLVTYASMRSSGQAVKIYRGYIAGKIEIYLFAILCSLRLSREPLTARQFALESLSPTFWPVHSYFCGF